MSKIANVLIVDDEEGVREIIASVVVELNAQYQEACDGEQAFNLLKKHEFDLIISDIMMPKRNGIELLELMRQNSMHEPFIVVTGFASKEFAIKALKLGAFDFIEKPFDIQAISKVIQGALEYSIELKEVRSKIELEIINPKNQQLTIEQRESLIKLSNLTALKTKRY